MTGFVKAAGSKIRTHSGSIKKLLSLLFFIAVAFLLVNKAQSLEWQKIWQAFVSTSPVAIATSLILGLACYSAYAGYDLIGRYVLGLRCSPVKVWMAAWISYAVNLNFGAIIGSIAFRYRLYSRLGVAPADVTRIIGISVFSNWLGYLLLAAGLFLSGIFKPPSSWIIGQFGLQLLGACFLLVVVTYIGLCLFSSRREYCIRGFTLVLPSWQVVLWQFFTALVHWTLMAAVMMQFFAGQVDFGTVYVVLLVSCIAGAVSHVPGGLGVIEFVFIAMLGGQLDSSAIVAALFAYRSVFYVFPLLLALPLYLCFETIFSRDSSSVEQANTLVKSQC